MNIVKIFKRAYKIIVIVTYIVYNNHMKKVPDQDRLFDVGVFDEATSSTGIDSNGAVAGSDNDGESLTPVKAPGDGVEWQRHIKKGRMVLAQLRLRYGPSDAERIDALQKAADAQQASEASRHEHLKILAERINY